VAKVEFSQLPRPAGLIEVGSVMDIGAGLRPMGWYKPVVHLCVEPHAPYASMLSEAGYAVQRMTAKQALTSRILERFDAIYLLDVIEHMTREDGEDVLWEAVVYGAKQVVVSTPNGFLEQEGDAWGLGGEGWQKHRSGWVPADFPGWTISLYDNGHPQGGFTAVSPPRLRAK
jgi:hypothetical protein